MTEKVPTAAFLRKQTVVTGPAFKTYSLIGNVAVVATSCDLHTVWDTWNNKEQVGKIPTVFSSVYIGIY